MYIERFDLCVDLIAFYTNVCTVSLHVNSVYVCLFVYNGIALLFVCLLLLINCMRNNCDNEYKINE